uniref:PHD domain-containing protein n=1 Tax=Caenorhabditis japonica TaxID=281687 RepID=A0A8R1DXD3_CAEJA
MTSDNPNDPVAHIINVFATINNEIPAKTKSALLEIERLDREVIRLKETVRQKQINYMANHDRLTGEQRMRAFIALQEEIQKIADLSDKKVEIVSDVKESVNAVYENLLIEEKNFIENIPTAAEIAEMSCPNSHRKKASDGESEGSEEEDDGVDAETGDTAMQNGRKRRKMKKKDADVPKSYCWCQLEKNDQMVCCENESCQYEWFHFSCIGMSVAPSGDWFCCDGCRSVGKPAKTSDKPGRKSLKRKKV